MVAFAALKCKDKYIKQLIATTTAQALNKVAILSLICLMVLVFLNGKLVSALRNLNYLIDYLSATLREKPTTYPFENSIKSLTNIHENC